jgi:hypothetical protein
MPFDFNNTESWDVSTGEYLMAGNHVVTIQDIEPGKSTRDNPQIRMTFGNANGIQKDRLTITEATFGKVVALAQATGVAPTEEEQAYFQENNGEPPASWLKRLLGKRLGIVVRMEDDQNGERNERTGEVLQWARVKGYVTAESIAPSSDLGPAPQMAAQGGAAEDKSLPF